MRYIAFILAPAILLAGLAAARAAEAAPPPIRIAVFPFELEDFSAATGSVPPDDIDREQLRLSTEEARRLLAESGRYQLVDAVRRTTRRRKPANCGIARVAKPKSPRALAPISR
jgi:hypothetical protein